MLALDITNDSSNLIAAGSGSILTTWLPPLLMVIGVIILGILLVIALRGTKYKSGTAASASAPTSATPSSPSSTTSAASTNGAAGGHVLSARRQIQDAHGLANDLLADAQRLSGALDHKSRQLEELLSAAEARIADLTAMVERAIEVRSESPDPTPSMRKSMIGPNHDADAAPVNATHRTSPRVEHEIHIERDPLTRSVYRLSDAGRKPLDIARELHEQVGKVELILALRGW